MWPFSNSDDDPVNKLDPELRKFLAKEAPQSKSRSAPPHTQTQPSEPAIHRSYTSHSTEPSNQQSPSVPPQSQFQDGRYAHLWKTYNQTGASAAVSDGEILQDLTRSFQWRRQQISNAALENCAFEAIAEQDCWRNGSFGQKLWMCRDETKALDRCTQLQTKFLQALGYLTTEDRPHDVDDRIQMHADRLYQQMLEHEKALKVAKEQGVPPPEFQPVLSKENLAKVLGVQATGYMDTVKQAEVMASKEDLSHIPENMREKYQKTVEGMTPDERLVEEAANIATARDHSGLAKNYQQFVGQRKLEETRRRESGSATITDRIRALWSKE